MLVARSVPVFTLMLARRKGLFQAEKVQITYVIGPHLARREFTAQSLISHLAETMRLFQGYRWNLRSNTVLMCRAHVHQGKSHLLESDA